MNIIFYPLHGGNVDDETHSNASRNHVYLSEHWCLTMNLKICEVRTAGVKMVWRGVVSYIMHGKPLQYTEMCHLTGETKRDNKYHVDRYCF